jgi:enamine deaminase RidA (YjgF/YER057c/UK114 family)
LAADVPALLPRPPRWVDRLFARTHDTVSSEGVHVSASGGSALFSTCITGATSLVPTRLRASVADTYATLRRAVLARGRSAVRFWNFVPAPGEPMGPGLDRYMVFNEGRYDAYAQWYGSSDAFSHRLATASTVGIDGRDLTIWCLALDAPGTPVENPRQTPSWRYSPRYGPRPPCFARATIVTLGGERRLLIGGTASIVGEDSRHLGDPAAQIEETLANVRAVMAAARGVDAPETNELNRLTDARVYVPRRQDIAIIRSMIDSQCRGLVDLEVWQSQVCRPELLVEVEGVALL